jgi:hypothetical protein
LRTAGIAARRRLAPKASAIICTPDELVTGPAARAINRNR